MCNFSLDGTQAKGYSSSSSLTLSLSFFLFFWVVSTLPPSSPFHAPWCLHLVTCLPSINFSCLSFFLLLLWSSEFPHTHFLEVWVPSPYVHRNSLRSSISLDIFLRLFILYAPANLYLLADICFVYKVWVVVRRNWKCLTSAEAVEKPGGCEQQWIKERYHECRWKTEERNAGTKWGASAEHCRTSDV